MGDDPLGLTPTAEELINEIGAAFVTSPPPDSFTLSDFIALKGGSETTAYRYLERLVMQGKLGKMMVGKKNYYHRIGGA